MGLVAWFHFLLDGACQYQQVQVFQLIQPGYQVHVVELWALQIPFGLQALSASGEMSPNHRLVH